MSQRNVERVIGRLTTDEALRRRFSRDPVTTIREVAEVDVELNAAERQALAAIDHRLLSLFARALDPRIQKVEVGGAK